MSQPQTSTRQRWLKWLGWGVAGLAALVGTLYFVMTSSVFLRGVILPRVGEALDAEVWAATAEIHPFSSIALGDVKVTAKNGGLTGQADTVTVRYNLWKILGGDIVIHEVLLRAPKITILEKDDPPAAKAKSEEKPTPPGKSAPPMLDIKSIRIENATVRYVKELPGGAQQTVEVTQLHVAVTDIKNGGTGKLTVAAALAAHRLGSHLSAKAEAVFTVAFDAAMQPTAVIGTKSLTIEQATGDFAALALTETKFDCNVAINHATRAATVKTLRLAGTQKRRPLMQVELSEPMTVAWGDRAEPGPDATLSFTVTELNLADWKPLAGDSLPGGVANVKLKVVAAQAGQQLTFDLSGQVTALTLAGAPAVDVGLKANGRVTDLQKFEVRECRLEVTQRKHVVLTVTGTGQFDKQTETGEAQLTLTTPLNRLATVLAVPNLTARSGQLELSTRVTRTPQTQTATGKLTLADFTGRYDDYRFENFGAAFDLEVARTGEQVDIRKAAGQFRGGGQLDVTGRYDGATKAGQFAVKLADFRESDLRPFLQPALGENKLVSITVNTTATTEFDATGKAAVKGHLHVANLVVQNPTNRVAASALEARLQFDATARKSVLTLQQCDLALKPTTRANNEVRLTGTVDYGNSNALTGELKLAATALDLTGYYDLLAGPNQTSPAPKTNVVGGVAEPEAVTLPFRDFTLGVAIDRCYLRELDIANLRTTVKLNTGQVVVKPLQFTLNGGPIQSTLELDLGVPGYTYDFALSADKVPLGPLADSFSPTYRESAQGNLSGKIQIKGAGTTGRSLRGSLAGTTTLAVHDANIRIVGPVSKAILGSLSVALGAPEVLTAPLDYLDCELRFGGGQIEMRKFTARSTAVLCESRGTIPIADVLADSPLNQPIDLALSRKLAQRLRPNKPAEEGYAKWPTMAHLIGTLGEPTTKTFAGQAFDATTNALSKTTSAVKGALGKVFSGADASATNATTSTNRSLNPLNLFQRKKEE